MGKGKAKREKDKYYHLAKESGFRARSCFKLIEIDKRFNLLGSANVVLDLCAAPGGWLQVAAKHCPISTTIIGVDLIHIRRIPNVITHECDITTPHCRDLLRKDLGKKKADVVLHDGAPNVGAAWAKDAFTQSELTLASLKLAVEFLRPGGAFITKVFRSSDYHSLLWVFQQLFDRVDTMKPNSSRSTSAEIFLICQNYKAPLRVDPKLLSPHFVFQELETGPKVVDVMHAKNDQRRNRAGYDDSLGQTLHRKTSISEFIESLDPVHVLSDTNELVFTESASDQALLALPSTNDDIKACCADLKVLGKPEFKQLLKWRTSILKTRRAAIRKEKAAEAAAASAAAVPKTEEEKAADEEEKLQDEIALALERQQREQRRERKRESKLKNKRLRRRALGIDGNAIDAMEQNEELFSLSMIKSKADLDDLVDVDLDKVDGSMVPAGHINVQDEDDEPDLSLTNGFLPDNSDYESADESDGVDSDDSVARRQAQLEEELDRNYREFQARRSERSKAGTKKSIGVKLTRRQRMEQEAKELEKKMNSKLDYAHQGYLRLLAGATGGKAGGGGSDSDDDDEDSESDDEREAALVRSTMGLAPELKGESFGPTPGARAARWFSQPLFSTSNGSGAGAGAGAGSGAASGAGAASFDVAEFGADDSDESDESDEDMGEGDEDGDSVYSVDGESDSEEDKDDEDDDEDEEDEDDEAEAPGPVGIGVLAPGKDALDGDSSDSDADVNPMANVPISEREKRKQRLAKARKKAEATAERRSKKQGHGFEVVAAEFSDSDVEEAPVELTEAEKKAQELIRAGMGKVLTDAEALDKKGKKKKTEFEVVPAGMDPLLGTRSRGGDGVGNGSGGGAVGGSGGVGANQSLADIDPRLLDYDSDTHAEMLALGLKMRRHTQAKSLVDASYNRYSFNDDPLPRWFTDDERDHFRPQLPITKEEVDRIKDQFRDVAARPIQKVAEARARKKGRATKKLEKAKRIASAIADNSEMGERSKIKAMMSAMNRGRSTAGATKDRASKKPLDSRLKADKRGEKVTTNQAKRSRGGRRTSTRSAKGKKRHRSRR